MPPSFRRWGRERIFADFRVMDLCCNQHCLILLWFPFALLHFQSPGSSPHASPQCSITVLEAELHSLGWFCLAFPGAYIYIYFIVTWLEGWEICPDNQQSEWSESIEFCQAEGRDGECDCIEKFKFELWAAAFWYWQFWSWFSMLLCAFLLYSWFKEQTGQLREVSLFPPLFPSMCFSRRKVFQTGLQLQKTQLCCLLEVHPVDLCMTKCC